MLSRAENQGPGNTTRDTLKFPIHLGEPLAKETVLTLLPRHRITSQREGVSPHQPLQTFHLRAGLALAAQHFSLPVCCAGHPHSPQSPEQLCQTPVLLRPSQFPENHLQTAAHWYKAASPPSPHRGGYFGFNHVGFEFHILHGSRTRQHVNEFAAASPVHLSIVSSFQQTQRLKPSHQERQKLPSSSI